MRGERDDGRAFGGGFAFVLADGPRRLETIQFGHFTIHQDQIETLPRHQLGGNGAVGRGDDAAAHILQYAGGDILVYRIVLGHQDRASKQAFCPRAWGLT